MNRTKTTETAGAAPEVRETLPKLTEAEKSHNEGDLFFNSDVMDCVDYAECMADKFEQPDRFLKAIIGKLELSARADPIWMRLHPEETFAPRTSDIVNSWSRELGLPETADYSDKEASKAANRIWSYVSTRLFSSKPMVEKK